jgi:hypothetical protein
VKVTPIYARLTPQQRRQRALVWIKRLEVAVTKWCASVNAALEKTQGETATQVETAVYRGEVADKDSKNKEPS